MDASRCKRSDDDRANAWPLTPDDATALQQTLDDRVSQVNRLGGRT